MDTGQFPKIFVTCGDVTGLAMASFYANWKRKYITHIVGSHQCDHLIQRELALEPDAGFYLLVDSTIDSVKVAEHLINIISEDNLVSLIIFSTHDERRSLLFEERLTRLQLNLKFTIYFFDMTSFNAAVGVHAHDSSGWSLFNLDYGGVCNFFNSGTQLFCVNSKASSATEFPYFLYTSYQQLLKKEETEQLRLTAVICVLIGDDEEATFDSTCACSWLISSLSKNLIQSLIHNNVQKGFDCEIELVGCYEIFEKNTTEIIRMQENTLRDEFNRVAYNSIEPLYSNDIAETYPMFIYGDTGVGKTHLLNYLKLNLTTRYLPHQILYYRAEDWIKIMLKSLETNTFDSFAEHFLGARVLLIDNVDFFIHKHRSQTEFLRFLEITLANNVPIILAGINDPQAMSGFETRLKSRFCSGTVIQIHNPDCDVRMRFAIAYAKQKNLILDNEAAQAIANIASNFFELEGAIHRLSVALCNIEMKSVSVGDVNSVYGVSL